MAWSSGEIACAGGTVRTPGIKDGEVSNFLSCLGSKQCVRPTGKARRSFTGVFRNHLIRLREQR